MRLFLRNEVLCSRRNAQKTLRFDRFSSGVRLEALANSTSFLQERVERVMSQRLVHLTSFVDRRLTYILRFFMVERSRNGDELREQFNVLGSTGNVCDYAVSP